MTDVLAKPAPARAFESTDFDDLIPGAAVVVEWADDGLLRVSFDVELSDDQVAAVRRRMVSSDGVEEELRRQCERFLATDPDTLDLPTLARSGQVLVQLVLKLRH